MIASMDEKEGNEESIAKARKGENAKGKKKGDGSQVRIPHWASFNVPFRAFALSRFRDENIGTVL